MTQEEIASLGRGVRDAGCHRAIGIGRRGPASGVPGQRDRPPAAWRGSWACTKPVSWAGPGRRTETATDLHGYLLGDGNECDNHHF